MSLWLGRERSCEDRDRATERRFLLGHAVQVELVLVKLVLFELVFVELVSVELVLVELVLV